MKNLVIGNLRLKSPVLLAPMVDVTDVAYRLVCREKGAAIGYTEMMHALSILNGFKSKAVRDKLKFSEDERPVGIQITGTTLDSIKKLCDSGKLNDYNLVDLNCGCPGHLTIDSGSGSYLLNTPEKIGKMIKILKENNVGKNGVVTAKIRLGYKNNNVMEVSKIIEKSGADALTIHGRLANQGRGVKADWKEIEKVKRNIGIPVIGNGDVDSGKSAREVLEFADGVMIARAAIGNPTIFENVLHYLKTGKEKEFNFKKNAKLYLKYLELAKKYDVISTKRTKYLGMNFLKGVAGAPKMREEFSRLKNYEDMKKYFERVV